MTQCKEKRIALLLEGNETLDQRDESRVVPVSDVNKESRDQCFQVLAWGCTHRNDQLFNLKARMDKQTCWGPHARRTCLHVSCVPEGSLLGNCSSHFLRFTPPACRPMISPSSVACTETPTEVVVVAAATSVMIVGATGAEGMGAGARPMDSRRLRKCIVTERREEQKGRGSD